MLLSKCLDVSFFFNIKVKNSGIPQGTLIRRHRIPLQAPNDDQFYTVEHFNVGNEIVLYGRYALRNMIFLFLLMKVHICLQEI